MGVEIKINKSSRQKRLVVAATVAALCIGFTAPAFADSAEDLLNKLLQKGILTQDEYDQMLQEMRAEHKADAMQNAQAAEEAEKAEKDAKAMSVSKTNVNIKLGGFIEAASIYRNENETADLASAWIAKGFSTTAGAGVPFANTPAAQTPEFRESARQSRISLLATGNPDDKTAMAAYFEADFLGAAQTANSQETNSYTPRLRQAYATWEQSDLGVHFLAGQSWSLVTPYKDGITPRDENIPLTIDAQYVPGFDFKRQPGLRLVKDFADKTFWLGLSVESPQAIVAGQTPSYFTTVASNPNTNPAVGATFTASPLVSTVATEIGGSGFNNANALTTDTRPDIILKGAADPGWGHYELYGLYRWFTDRTNDPNAGVLATAATGSGSNSTTSGEGIGGSVLLPIVPHMFDVTGSFLTGKGIGSYGASQLPDVTYNLDGTYAAIPATHFLLGAILHPTPDWDIFGYYGKESETETAFSSTGFENPIIYANTHGVPATPGGSLVPVTYLPSDVTTFSGYGLPLLDAYGCSANPTHAVGSAANCSSVTASTQQWTLGAWWSFYKGAYGTAKWGLTYSHTTVSTYAAIDGAPSPDINMVMLGFRYYPYQ